MALARRRMSGLSSKSVHITCKVLLKSQLYPEPALTGICQGPVQTNLALR